MRRRESSRANRREEYLKNIRTALGRPGSDLLSHALRRSTIGAEEFNGRVRNGIGFGPLAKTTRPAKRRSDDEGQALRADPRLRNTCLFTGLVLFFPSSGTCRPMGIENESDQAERAISTGKLHALLRFHTRPINVVVFHDSSGRTRLEVGFPLRCFQRLSRPYIATLQCRWRDNRSTRGTSIPVLSY